MGSGSETQGCTSGFRVGIPESGIPESGSVIGADRNGLGPLVCCRKAGHKAKRRVEVQYSPTYAGARARRGGVTRQGVVLTDLQSLLNCQQTFISLSLPLVQWRTVFMYCQSGSCPSGSMDGLEPRLTTNAGIRPGRGPARHALLVTLLVTFIISCDIHDIID